jgi:phytoene synthase
VDELRQGIANERFRKLMKFEAERAREYYAGARNLLPLVEVCSQPALWAMIKIYERILDRIEQQQFDVFHNPIHLASTEKISIALKALGMRFFGKPGFGTQHA